MPDVNASSVLCRDAHHARRIRFEIECVEVRVIGLAQEHEVALRGELKPGDLVAALGPGEHKLEIEPVMEFDNIETVKRAVEIDHGIAIVPQATVAQEQKQGTLAVLRFKGKEFTRPLAILHRKGRVLTPAMKKFIETLGLDLPEMRDN